MTILRLQGDKLFVDTPTLLFPPATNTYWTATHKPCGAVELSGALKYYTKTVINTDTVSGYTVDPERHTITLIIKYTTRLFDIPFEAQGEYEDGVAVMNQVFGVTP